MLSLQVTLQGNAQCWAPMASCPGQGSGVWNHSGGLGWGLPLPSVQRLLYGGDGRVAGAPIQGQQG